MLRQVYKKDLFKETLAQNTKYSSLIAKAESIKNEPIKVSYVSIPTLYNPAFYHNKVVYINLAGKGLESQYEEGMLAHELGHAISGYADQFIFLNIRISVIFRTIVLNMRNRVLAKNKALPKWFDFILYYSLFFLSFIDDLILYRFIRQEEFEANKYACMITSGHSLRTYYYKMHLRYKRQMYPFDLLHPSPKAMIDEMNTFMEIDDLDKPIYHVDYRVYYVERLDKEEDINSLKFSFYARHSNTNHIRVLDTLSHYYMRGIGTERDLDKALHYAYISCHNHNIRGCYNMGLIYEMLEEYTLALNHFMMAQDKIPSAKQKIKTIQRKIELQDQETRVS
jgi:hypothetical protein